MLKKIMFGFAGLILVVSLGANFLMSGIDNFVKSTIVKYGSEATKADVKLDRVKLSLGAGRGQGELDGLSVSNPAGFSSGKSIAAGTVSLQIDTQSMSGNGPIVIRTIVIDRPQVAYELNNDGSSNLQTIQRNTQEYANTMAGGAVPSDRTATPAKPPRKVIIKDLLITNGNVSISQASLKDQKLATSLPTIHLADIGQASGGATAAQVAEQVLGSISNEAAQSAIAELARQKISGALKDVPGAAIGGAAVDNVGSQIKGLFSQ